MEIYERNINISCAVLDEGQLTTKASLLDLNHNMRVEITIDQKTHTIIDATSQMVKVPFHICALTTDRVKNIIGFTIERGINRKLADTLGRSEGCSHLFELALEAVRLSSNILLGFSHMEEEWRDRRLNDEDFIERAKPFLKNTCLPFYEPIIKE
jgi:hypothetical protein